MTAVVVGAWPATRATRGDLRAVIAADARSTSAEGRRLHRTFAVVQIALAAVLLGGAALTLRSVHALTAVDPGVSMDGLVTARISLGAPTYRQSGRAATFFDELGRRLRDVPGISGAGATARLPLEGASWTGTLFVEADPSITGTELRHKSVTPGYLEAVGHRLIAGRTIESGDRADAPLVVVINETMKRTYFPATNPVGQRVAWDAPGPRVRWRTIVGVVSDERQDGLGVPVRPEVFDSAFQEGFSSMAVAVRATLPMEAVPAEIRRAVRELDPQVAVFDEGPFADRVHRSTLRERLAAWLIGVFAVIGIALAGVGTYSIVARAVAARTREIGVRVACGATAVDVVRMLVRDHLRVAAMGLAAGVPLVFISAHALVTVLYGVTPADPVSIAAAVAVPLLVAGAASIVPARRALRVDPVSALKAGG
jgi:predicted permease